MTDAKQKQFRAIRGTRDILPPDTDQWNRVEQTAREVFASYGLGEIRLPILEQKDLFARAVGADTDIVGKEMFVFEDRPPNLPDPKSKIITSEEATALEEAAKRDVIPNSEGNRTAIQALSRLLAEKNPSEMTIQEYTQFVSKYLLLAQLINLGDMLTLRPEATASVARAYVQHGMQSWPQPVKLYYTGPMFRRERPQKGRYRQFHQIGAEILGRGDEVSVDTDVLEMVMRLMERVGVTRTILYINSIGCKKCRAEYIEILRSELFKVKDRLSAESQRRIETNPLRVLDSKNPHEHEIIEGLPRISNHLCADCHANFDQLKRALDLRGIKYQENWRLVRGLDYYTRTTFEVTAEGLGSQNAVCGGGRYDGLVEMLGGPPTPAIGFAIGTERLLMALNEASSLGKDVEEKSPAIPVVMHRPDAVVAGTDEDTWRRATLLAGELRKNGLSVHLPKSGMKLPKVMEAAHKLGTRIVIIVGENELKKHQYGVRILSPLIQSAEQDVRVKESKVLLYGKIVKLRQDLERSLSKLATGASTIGEQRGISRVVDHLMKSGILPPEIASSIRNVLPNLNRAIHGEDLADGSIEWALAYGNLLLNELERLSPFEE